MNDQEQKSRILIADDDPELVGILLKRLQSMDCEIITASDGAQALRLIKQHKPDVVILDVMMPHMNGWEVCKAIRKSKELAHTKVIMLTGIGESLNDITSPLYGADDHLNKPFNFAELTFKIKRLLSDRA